MNEGEFQNQINRIERQFSKFGNERSAILWREVKGFSSSWFMSVVDDLISESRHCPVPADFRDRISRERERIHNLEKVQHGQDAKDFFEGTYQPDDMKTICQMITKRLKGGISDSDFEKFVGNLENAAKMNPKVVAMNLCHDCEDSGLVFKKKQEKFLTQCTDVTANRGSKSQRAI